LRISQRTADFDYALPVELIAQAPSPVRDASRLLVVDANAISHRHFAELAHLLHAGDLLVLNETRVIAARLDGERRRDGEAKGHAELLLLHPAEQLEYDAGARRWIALARPARRLRRGDVVAFAAGGEAVVCSELAAGMREIELRIDVPLDAFLARSGRMPLPPYIRNDSLQAQERYQTVFAREPGSVAAPTASLHFTPELIDELARKGVEVVKISLEVGLGTFRPVTAEAIEDHVMHEEAYAIEPAAAERIERAREAGRRIVAAGTTVVRALEGNHRAFGRIRSGRHRTGLFITPGFRFAVVDALITNFHLPRSTLLMLVCAFAGRERVLRAYAEAIERRYRFYSFGDAMFVASRTPA
jgi:S-adenosylmethionine:tRNA ribosyltransferase-isomerase